MTYQNFHKHSYYTNIIIPDSACSIEAYAKRAKELGHSILSSVEHGWAGDAFKTYNIAQKYGLKFIYGSEAYFVKNRTEKDGTNCHICVFAKNEQGRKELNAALSEANISGFYRVPRLDMSLLLGLSRGNILITTGCVAFHKYGLTDTTNIILQLFENFKDDFFLEVQYHDMAIQKEVNKFLLGCKAKYGIPIIMGTDSHYILPEDSKERNNVLHAKNIYYENEEGCILDYPTTKDAITRFEDQQILSDKEIKEAIDNTHVFLDFENISFGKHIKLPTIYPLKTQEEKNEIFKELIKIKWLEFKKTVDQTKLQHYEQEIKKEVDCIINTKMTDYFLLDYEIVQKALKKGGTITLTGRGSSASFLVNTLLGFSELDRIAAPVTLYPERFMSETRILQTKSLPDLDLNTGNPDIFLEAQGEILGENSSYQMIAFGKFKAKSAFKLYAKSQNIPFHIANIITSQLDLYEKDLKHCENEEELNLYNYVDKEYHALIKESVKYQNIISDKKPAPCSSLILQGNIKEEIGLIKIRGKKDILVAAIDGSSADEFNFLKNDLLKVDVVNIIYFTFKKLGMKPFTVNELLKKTENDSRVWGIYAEGKTVCLNQVEKHSTRQKIMRYKPRNITELTSFIAAIRPSFQSMYALFEKREKFIYGIKAFDSILQTKDMQSSFLIYQEQIMSTLNYAGIDNKETYGIIKAIAKKKVDKILKWKDLFIKNFTQKIMDSENLDKKEAIKKTLQVWKIIEDSSAYGFNASHAYSVACDSLYCAYLKAYYPLEFFETVLNYYMEKQDKPKISEIKKEAENLFGLTIKPIRFRDNNRKFKINGTKTINEAMSSIKHLNKQISKELYKLRDEKYGNFLDLLVDMHQKTSIQSNQLSILIKLDYFFEFGINSELLEYVKIFRIYWTQSKKTFRKQISKLKIQQLELNQDIIAKYSSETECMHNKMETRSIILDNFKLVKACEIPLIEQLKIELEYLGYIRYRTTPKERHRVFILEIINADKKINPKLKIYSIGTGNIAVLKIRKHLCTFNQFEIIYITKLEAKQRYYYLGLDEKGKQKFEKSETEKEWWIEEWIR